MRAWSAIPFMDCPFMQSIKALHSSDYHKILLAVAPTIIHNVLIFIDKYSQSIKFSIDK